MKLLALTFFVLTAVVAAKPAAALPPVVLEIYASTALYRSEMAYGSATERQGDSFASKGNLAAAAEAYLNAAAAYERAADATDDDKDYNDARNAAVKVGWKYDRVQDK